MHSKLVKSTSKIRLRSRSRNYSEFLCYLRIAMMGLAVAVVHYWPTVEFSMPLFGNTASMMITHITATLYSYR